ncbi:uncharacterized protein LOC143039477 [Oratosquilla oratoria]|uniref:uncharacterized protein LOC143039477 n=1 Tax=Oratosquilla oratoria TaxID=337810 RepID=UPI003F777405
MILWAARDDDEDSQFVPISHDPSSPGPGNEPPAKRWCTAPLFEEEDHEEEDNRQEEEEEEEANRKGIGKGTAKTKRRKKDCPLSVAHNLQGGHQQSPLPTCNYQPPTYV